MNRRKFLRRSAAAAAVLGFPAVLRSASPNSMLQVACIGVGRMGGNTMKAVASHPKVKITALCDVDTGFLDPAAKTHPDASKHRDWRELLSGHAGKFDALTIGTPDHMHAAPAVTALRAKKHLYLQKPMATTLHECRVITEEARKAGVVTQLGNQGRSTIESRMAVQLLRSGAIGKVKEVILWENKPLGWWPKNTELRRQGDAIPAGLDWNLWLGVQEPRPYLADTYHPQNWRAWFGFGVGEMGDMGCHHFDTSFDALELSAPLRVRQTTPGSSGPLWGKSRVVEMIFPGSDITAGKSVQLTWHDGGIEPDARKIQLPKGVAKLPESGTYWIGEHGAIYKNYRGGKPIVLPEEKFAAEKYPADLKPQNHYHDWVDAILEGRKACDEFTHGGPLTETVLVGAMADRHAGEWLEWDRKALKFTNNAKATALVRRAYRDGWKVAGLG
jgi:predicted dehydrogenase